MTRLPVWAYAGTEDTTQYQGRPLRTLYAFDSRRCAILLLCGDKTGNNRWYEMNVPKADAIYQEDYLNGLRREGIIE